MTKRVTFIHAADLHIDSPLRGLEAYEGAPLQQLRGATRKAANALVQLAIEESVDFVVIAGDLFDGKWQDMRTGLWTAARFRELDRAGIQVFLLQGNHDAASKVRQAIRWPANVHVFSSQHPETVTLETLGVALHGQGFAHEKITGDLAARYPDATPGLFNIGVLHSSLTGSTEHDTYAPTRLAVLLNRGYNYWALGHIHARSDPPIQQQPFIAYAGNTQGRHVKETGAKGCLLVQIENGELCDVTFHATDVVRWERVEIELGLNDGRDALLQAIAGRLAALREHIDGQLLAARIVIRGACRLHHTLGNEADRDEIIAEIRNLANSLDQPTWIEKIVLETAPPVDLQRLRQGKDLIGQLLRGIERTADDADMLASLAESFQPIIDKAGSELNHIGLDFRDPEQLRYWIEQAEMHVVTQLLEGNE